MQGRVELPLEVVPRNSLVKKPDRPYMTSAFHREHKAMNQTIWSKYFTFHLCFSEMLKPGSHFVIIDVMDQTSYFVDDVKFSLLRVTEDEIKTAFLQNGFEIEQFETHSLANYPKTELSDAKTVYFIVGKKM